MAGLTGKNAGRLVYWPNRWCASLCFRPPNRPIIGFSWRRGVRTVAEHIARLGTPERRHAAYSGRTTAALWSAAGATRKGITVARFGTPLAAATGTSSARASLAIGEHDYSGLTRGLSHTYHSTRTPSFEGSQSLLWKPTRVIANCPGPENQHSPTLAERM